MAKTAPPACPNCKGALIPIAAVFEAFENAIDQGAKLIANTVPVSKVFFCKTCKQIVWMDRKGKKTMKPAAKPKRPRKKSHLK